jgi:hypothetical protein
VPKVSYMHYIHTYVNETVAASLQTIRSQSATAWPNQHPTTVLEVETHCDRSKWSVCVAQNEVGLISEVSYFHRLQPTRRRRSAPSVRSNARPQAVLVWRPGQADNGECMVLAKIDSDQRNERVQRRDVG